MSVHSPPNHAILSVRTQKAVTSVPVLEGIFCKKMEKHVKVSGKDATIIKADKSTQLMEQMHWVSIVLSSHNDNKGDIIVI